MGCNTSKETVHPTDESKENNDNQIKDVSNKEEINNIDDVHNNDATINTVVNGTEELKESINAAKEKNEEKSSSARTIVLRTEEIKNESLHNNIESDLGIEEPEDPVELEGAATKIQAAFRGHQTRKNMKQADKPNVSEPEPEPTQEELEAEFRADDVELCHAATKIQASFRGHMARKQKDEKETVEEKTQQDDEEVDIDLSDPDLNKAAIKIQASFRGHMVRKDNDVKN